MIYLLSFIFIAILFVLIPINNVEVILIKIKEHIFSILLVIFVMLLIVFSESSFKSAHNGFMLWANNVLPALFPFLICIELIKTTNIMEFLGKVLEPIMKKLFNVPGCGAFAIAMGISSGYPVGAKIVSDLRENNCCSKTESERLLAFTNTSGPLFIVGSVGIGMFGDNRIGILLLLTHFLSSIIVGILFRFYHSKDKTLTSNNFVFNKKMNFKFSMFGEIMSNAIKNSISTLLLICGYMMFFSVFTNILITTNIASTLSKVISPILNALRLSPELSIPIITGVFEVTSGVSKLSLLTEIDFIKLLSCVAFVLGLGGFSVCMQVNSIISKTDLSIKPYIFGKTLQGIIASILTFIIGKYTNILNIKSLEVMNYQNLKFIKSSNSLIISITSLILICILINQILKLNKKDII